MFYTLHHLHTHTELPQRRCLITAYLYTFPVVITVFAAPDRDLPAAARVHRARLPSLPLLRIVLSTPLDVSPAEAGGKAGSDLRSAT